MLPAVRRRIAPFTKVPLSPARKGFEHDSKIVSLGCLECFCCRSGALGRRWQWVQRSSSGRRRLRGSTGRSVSSRRRLHRSHSLPAVRARLRMRDPQLSLHQWDLRGADLRVSGHLVRRAGGGVHRTRPELHAVQRLQMGRLQLCFHGRLRRDVHWRGLRRTLPGRRELSGRTSGLPRLRLHERSARSHQRTARGPPTLHLGRTMRNRPAGLLLHLRERRDLPRRLHTLRSTSEVLPFPRREPLLRVSGRMRHLAPSRVLERRLHGAAGAVKSGCAVNREISVLTPQIATEVGSQDTSEQEEVR